jgi:hypothetical protein
MEAKLTARPELAVAVNEMLVLAACIPMVPKSMLCVVLPVPVPLNVTVCVAYPGAGALSALSVSASVPLNKPGAEGVKLMGSRQDSPAARVPAEDPRLTSGHADVPLLFRVKFPRILGLSPLLRTGKSRAALPTFSTVTVCGLSLLVEPGAVGTKIRLGGSAKSSFNT